ncbi:hypothetical protein U8C44_10550 (plasmid) [Sinorhizobium meliloti]|nr:hypothetical protein [Sinorhizobium meliloti]WQO80101.1 hypothetical protein U8C44_10550 [Sinorhizobium meliloti]
MDRQIRFLIAIDIHVDERVRGLLVVPELAGHALEGGRSNERESLIAGELRAGVDRRKVDPIA